MEVRIKSSYELMCQAAASEVARVLNTKPNAVLGMATGSTPLGLYRELVRMHQEESLDFSHVTTFNLDEYIFKGYEGDLIGHEDSYKYFMYKHLFGFLTGETADPEFGTLPAEKRLRPENINFLKGNTENHDNEVERYRKRIEEYGRIDLMVLGIGVNGHIGFNEPGSGFI